MRRSLLALLALGLAAAGRPASLAGQFPGELAGRVTEARTGAGDAAPQPLSPVTA